MTYLPLRALYNITLHPLAEYPGPLFNAVCYIPFIRHIFQGDLPRTVKRLHDEYGPVVRISPSELSFTSAQAWHDIYGSRSPQNPKDLLSYTPPDEYWNKRMVMQDDDFKHHQVRSQISHAFSPKSLLELQPHINGYVNQLVGLMRASISQAHPVDVTAYFNWTTFDIIGHLTFGESFHCLDTESYHPWIKVVFEGVAAGHAIHQLSRYGLLWVIEWIVPKRIKRKRADMISFSNARMDARIKAGFGPGTPKDFAYFMSNGPERKSGRNGGNPNRTAMDRDVMCANGETLIIAGSETTATLLSGLTFLLLSKRPDYLERVTAEVREAFANDTLEQINFKTVTERLPLMIAAIREALRYYPPAPFGFARRIAQRPRMIDEFEIPPNTSVSVSHWAASHSAANWHRPDDFLPERWLDEASHSDSPFRNDKRDSSQPFSLGPRSCLGRT